MVSETFNLYPFLFLVDPPYCVVVGGRRQTENCHTIAVMQCEKNPLIRPLMDGPDPGDISRPTVGNSAKESMGFQMTPTPTTTPIHAKFTDSYDSDSDSDYDSDSSQIYRLRRLRL